MTMGALSAFPVALALLSALRGSAASFIDDGSAAKYILIASSPDSSHYLQTSSDKQCAVAAFGDASLADAVQIERQDSGQDSYLVWVNDANWALDVQSGGQLVANADIDSTPGQRWTIQALSDTTGMLYNNNAKGWLDVRADGKTPYIEPKKSDDTDPRVGQTWTFSRTRADAAGATSAAGSGSSTASTRDVSAAENAEGTVLTVTTTVTGCVQNSTATPNTQKRRAAAASGTATVTETAVVSSCGADATLTTTTRTGGPSGTGSAGASSSGAAASTASSVEASGSQSSGSQSTGSQSTGAQSSGSQTASGFAQSPSATAAASSQAAFSAVAGICAPLLMASLVALLAM